MQSSDSQKCDLSHHDQDSTIPAAKLYSSQPSVCTGKLNCEPTSPIVGSTAERPSIPPRNYRITPITPAVYNTYNRVGVPFSTPRLPYNSYSTYGYNSTFPYSYNSNVFGSYGFNGYNTSSSESRFIRAAEESTRPTFQAIESLTRAINSVAFMMESTFGSLNTSFQAILYVIENFSHARKFLKHVITSMLTFRIFHKFLLVLVNLMRKMNILSDQAVAHVSSVSGSIDSSHPGFSLWPIITFFGLMFGAPYIISNMLPTCEENSQNQNNWNPSTDRYVPLVGVYDFKSSNPQELSFCQGQQLRMVPQDIMPPSSPYWVFVADDQNKTGFVPRNHVAPAYI